MQSAGSINIGGPPSPILGNQVKKNRFSGYSLNRNQVLGRPRKLSESCENHANGVKCFLSFKEDIFTRSAVITRSNKQIHLKTFKQLIEGERSQNLL